MDLIGANLEKQYNNSNAGNGVGVRPLLEIFVSEIRRPLWVLFAAVGFVLLMPAPISPTCFWPAPARVKKRWRFARPWARAAGASRVSYLRKRSAGIDRRLAGVTAGPLGIEFILYISPNAIPRAKRLGSIGEWMAFTIGVSFVTGLLFGLVPALQAGVVDVHETLKETGRGTSRRHWLRSSLVVVEVATTLVLLIGAGLMIRSFYRLQKVNPGSLMNT